MKPTSEVLKRISKSSVEHPEGVFTRLYRYLLREDIYFMAYNDLYANAGASTMGTDNDTADGFSMEYVEETISLLKGMKYQPKPVRRTYIPKRNGKMRPLGIPSFRDKMVQDVIKQILEAIYEPIFDDNSHGFRPARSCHTALNRIRKGFNGVKWFIEGDIRGCFDNIDHQVLLKILSTKIKDSKFINLIGLFLKAGYLEDWVYHETYSGTPQGGILSPILANIYLSELDKKIEEIKKSFEPDNPRKKYTQEYSKVRYKAEKLSGLISNASTEEEKITLLRELREVNNHLKTIPVFEQINKRIVYVRYADDFLIGVDGSRNDCEKIKSELKGYLQEKMHLELSDEKTKITHSSENAKFLGYDVSVRRTNEIRKRSDGVKQRTLNYTVQLCIPLREKLEEFLLEHKYGIRKEDGTIQPIAHKVLQHKDDYEIVMTYITQIRGLWNYYRIASNSPKFDYFCYVMEYSCLKTLASKHKTTMSQAREERRKGDRWGVNHDGKFVQFPNMTDLRIAKLKAQYKEICDVKPKRVPKRNEIEIRLKTGICELCGRYNIPLQVHHVRKLSELKGETSWEKKMISINRKTLMICEDCHKSIHATN